MNSIGFYKFCLQIASPQDGVLKSLTAADFPDALAEISEHIRNKYRTDPAPVLTKIKSLRVLVASGMLYYKGSVSYSMFLSGGEDLTQLVVHQGNRAVPFSCGDCQNVILLSNYKLNDTAFVNTSVVHELGHFVRNFFQGEKPVGDYMEDPQEKESRALEKQVLTDRENLPDEAAERFLQNKYFPPSE
jgi:hypothetical protein